MKYEIKVSCDIEEGEQFVEWLNDRGHSAEIIDETGSYIDGVWTSTDEDSNKIMSRLWSEYCRS